MMLRIILARAVAFLLLLPAGLVCVAVPFWMLTLPGRSEIIDDTRAAFGAGVEGGRLKAAYVDCVAQRSGSSSGRGIGMTDYGCVIDLAEAPAPAASDQAPAASPPADFGEYDKTASHDEQMAEFNRRTAEVNRRLAEQSRRYQADLDAFIERSRARSDTSNRLERRLATNRSGELPAVRIVSEPGEPRRIGLVWGAGEIALRWLQWLVVSLIFFALGGGCLLAVRLAIRGPAASRMP
jgi:hypothetical protein